MNITTYKQTYINDSGRFYQRLDIDGVSNENGNVLENSFVFYLNVIEGKVYNESQVNKINDQWHADNGDTQYDLANNPEIVADGSKDSTLPQPFDVALVFKVQIY